MITSRSNNGNNKKVSTEEICNQNGNQSIMKHLSYMKRNIGCSQDKSKNTCKCIDSNCSSFRKECKIQKSSRNKTNK